MSPKRPTRWLCPRCGEELIVQDIDEVKRVEIGECINHHVYGRDMEDDHARGAGENPVPDMQVIRNARA